MYVKSSVGGEKAVTDASSRNKPSSISSASQPEEDGGSGSDSEEGSVGENFDYAILEPEVGSAGQLNFVFVPFEKKVFIDQLIIDLVVLNGT
jgi:hypothetical protein